MQEDVDRQEEEEELIDHYIDLDKYVQVTLRIPKRLNALQLKGIISKADKLYKVAEIPMEAVERESQSFPKKRRKYNYPTRLWEDDMVSELYRLNEIKKQSYEAIAFRINKLFSTTFSEEQVRQKISNLKTANRWGHNLLISKEEVQKKETYEKKVRLWTPEMVSELYILKEDPSLTFGQIAEKISEKFSLKMRRKQVEMKIANMKHRKQWGSHLLPEEEIAMPVGFPEEKSEEAQPVQRIPTPIIQKRKPKKRKPRIKITEKQKLNMSDLWEQGKDNEEVRTIMAKEDNLFLSQKQVADVKYNMKQRNLLNTEGDSQ